jgi:hypothetical protein
MEQVSLPTELIETQTQQSIGKVYLDWQPQPGTYVDFNGQTYAVLERRHRYQFKANKYRLHQIALYVQPTQTPTERSWVENRWVLGDASCTYNARSEILRCGVNPLGPCLGCPHYQNPNATQSDHSA